MNRLASLTWPAIGLIILAEAALLAWWLAPSVLPLLAVVLVLVAFYVVAMRILGSRRLADPVARHEGVVAGVPPAPATPEDDAMVEHMHLVGICADALDGDGSTPYMPDVEPMDAAVWMLAAIEKHGYQIVKRFEDSAALRTRLQQDDPEP